MGCWQEVCVVGEVGGGAGGGGGGGDLLEQQGGEHHPLQQQPLRLLRSLLLHGGQGQCQLHNFCSSTTADSVVDPNFSDLDPTFPINSDPDPVRIFFQLIILV